MKTLKQTDIEIWLSTRQVLENQAKFGKNILIQKTGHSLLSVFFSQFKSFLMIILFVAMGVSLRVQERLEASVIWIIIVLNAILGCIQEYKAEKSIEKLRNLSSPKVRVRRDWEDMMINAEDLVVWDVVLLEAGDRIVADCRLVNEQSLEAVEAVLTWESLPVEKVVDDMVFSGTSVSRGRWVAIVEAIGMSTELGKIAEMIQQAPEKQTKLQKDLDVMSKRIGSIILVICVIMFVINVFVLNVPAYEAFLVAIALSVAAIPEWLPTIVTVCLWIWLQKLAQKNALVKRLWSVETLWSVDVICTDKTWTLTKNEMTVVKLFVDWKVIDVWGIGYEDTNTKNIQVSRDEVPDLEMLLRIWILCNGAELWSWKSWDEIGDPTELSLIVSWLKWWLNLNQENKNYQLITELPFDSERKMMSMLRKNQHSYLLWTKWAPEMVLKSCQKYIDNWKIKDLTPEIRQKILTQNEEFARWALRVLGFAYREILSEPDLWDEESLWSLEKELIFVWLQGIIDPPREEVKASIAKCYQAGIKVIMITGDNELTAKAIARELWIDENDVYARVSPEDKQKLVQKLQNEWHVVAMTWDWVNDAPALKFADIWLAMWITGTEVSKEASDMILLDDNFKTIVSAIEQWRWIYANIKKFVHFLFATNFAEILIVFVSILLRLPLPLVAIQILWINLISDGLPALALWIDPYSPDLMIQKPRKIWSRIIDWPMIKSILMLSVIVSSICLIWFIYFYQTNLTQARSGVFMLIIILEMISIFVIRKQYGVKFWSNKRLFMAVLASIGLSFVLVRFWLFY